MKIHNILSKITITKAIIGITAIALFCLNLQPVFANSANTSSNAAVASNTVNKTFSKDKLPELKDFPVTESFKGKPKPVDLNSHPAAKRFKTRLSEGAAMGPNFAGHYTVVSIGAGTMAQELWIIDANTGKIITTDMADGSKKNVESIGTELWEEYNLNSRLLITNPPKEVETAGYKDAGWVRTQYFVMENGKMEKIFEVKTSEVLGSK